jgi:hypothetical protein
MNDQDKACYADALAMWRGSLRSHPDWKPSAASFGLTDEEAADVEAYGYDTSSIPAHLRWNGKALTDEQYAKLTQKQPPGAGTEGA